MDALPESDFRFEWQDTQDGDRRAAMLDSVRNAPTPSAGDVINAGIRMESVTRQMFEDNSDAQFFDPGYRLDTEALRKQAGEMGIPAHYLGALAEANSERHAQLIMRRLKEEVDARNTLTQAGLSGAVTSLLVSILDPASLATMAVPGGAVGLATKGGALKAALKAGLVAGGTNAGLEAQLAAGQYTRDPEDVVYAALIGLGLGGGIGALSGAWAKNAQNVFHNTVLRRAAKETGTPNVPALLSQADDPITGVALRRSTDLTPSVREGEYIPAGEPAPGQKALPHGSIDGEAVRVDDPAGLLNAPPRKLDGPAGAPRLPGPPEPPPKEPPDVPPNAIREPAPGDSAMARAFERAQGQAQMEEQLARDAAHARAQEELVRAKLEAEAQQKKMFEEGDHVEWDTPHGVEKGQVRKAFDDGRLLIEDDRGRFREFRSQEIDFDTAEESASSFLSGSIGSGQTGVIDQPRTALSYLKIPGTKLKIPLRFDAFAYFDRTDNEGLRRMANLFLDDPVGKTVVRDAAGKVVRDADGNKIYQANRLAATEYAEMDFKRWYGEADRAFTENFHVFLKNRNLTAAERVRASRDFAETVSLVIRDTSGELASRHPEAAAAAREIAMVNAKILARMKQVGVEGADEVAENFNYLMRRFDWDKIGKMSADPVVRKQLERLLGEAIRKARPEVEEARALAIGKSFLNRLRNVQTDRTNLGFLSDLGERRLAAALREGGTFSDDEVDDILSFVFNTTKRQKDGDAKAMPRLKHRAFLDENHSVRWNDPDGRGRALHFSDLLVNDVRTLNQIYMRQSSGMIALARVGVRSKADYQALREAARLEDVEKGVKADLTNRRLDGMDRVVRSILGQPMFEEMWGSDVSRFMRIFRNMNVATYLSQVGFAQLAETGQLLATKTAMALRTNMSAYDDALLKLTRGTADDNLIRDFRMMGAVAEESAIRRPYLKDYDPSEAIAGRADDLAAFGSHYVVKASGMAWLTETQREVLAKMYSQRLLNIAVGAEQMSNGLKARLATNGLEGDDLDATLSALKKYSRMDESGRSLIGIDYVRWESESQNTFDAFRLAVFRESHRGIQEVSLGATPLWMHSDIGKILFQFRSFVMNAYTKQLLYGIAHADLQTFATWTFSVMAGSLAYAAQTTVNFAGNPEELEKRLDPVELGKAGFQRAGFSSLIPMAVDTVMDYTTGDPIFKYGRSSNLGTGFLLGNPTVTTLGKIFGGTSALAQDLFTDDHVWTQKEVGYVTGLIPQFVGIRALLDAYKQEFPKRNFLREGEQ